MASHDNTSLPLLQEHSGQAPANLSLAKEEPWKNSVWRHSWECLCAKQLEQSLTRASTNHFSCSEVSEDVRLQKTFKRMVLLSLLLFVILAVKAETI